MMHDKRRWNIGEAESPEDLARRLTGRTWTLCTGFYVRGYENYLFLNDATCEDGAAEFAILLRDPDSGSCTQIESITFSWCDEGRALLYIKEVLSGAYDQVEYARPVSPRLQTPQEHGRCHLCA